MIFYEKEEAEKILSSGFSNFMSFKDLLLLAKYFKYIGKNKTQIKKSLVEFCEKHKQKDSFVINAIKKSKVVYGKTVSELL